MVNDEEPRRDRERDRRVNERTRRDIMMLSALGGTKGGISAIEVTAKS